MHCNHYEVSFLGATVQCESFEHARAIRTAKNILSGVNIRTYTPQQLAQLAKILTHYGCREAANALVDRAALILQGS